MSTNPLLRIIDENRSKVLTVGNINDLANVLVQFGTSVPDSSFEDYVSSLPEGDRILVVYSDDEPNDADAVFEASNGYLSVKKL